MTVLFRIYGVYTKNITGIKEAAESLGLSVYIGPTSFWEEHPEYIYIGMPIHAVRDEELEDNFKEVTKNHLINIGIKEKPMIIERFVS